MTLTELFALMDAADEALDGDVYEQIRKMGFDEPDDADVVISAGTLRKINKVFQAIEQLKCVAAV